MTMKETKRKKIRRKRKEKRKKKRRRRKKDEIQQALSFRSTRCHEDTQKEAAPSSESARGFRRKGNLSWVLKT